MTGRHPEVNEKTIQAKGGNKIEPHGVSEIRLRGVLPNLIEPNHKKKDYWSQRQQKIIPYFYRVEMIEV